jgi:hypothetical protein
MLKAKAAVSQTFWVEFSAPHIFPSVATDSPDAQSVFVCILKDHLACAGNIVNPGNPNQNSRLALIDDKVWLQYSAPSALWTVTTEVCSSAQHRNSGAMKV